MDDNNAPATKSDIALVLNRLDALTQEMAGVKQEVAGIKQDLEDFKVEVNMRFEQFEHRMEQQLLDHEAKIITSNYRLAESMQQL